MRKLTVAAVLAAAFVFVAVGSPAESQPEGHHRHCSVRFQEFAPWAERVWRTNHWGRAKPKPKTIEAYRHKLHCAAGPLHRVAMKGLWRKAKEDFYARRSKELFRVRVTPFYYAGHWWAAPYPIALCESGGHYYENEQGPLPFGAYGLIMEPEFLPAKEQDRIAHRLYLELGESPWAPYESGCAYR